jgi:hypothetical protein
MSVPNRRTRRLIEPRVQLRLVLVFLATASLAALVQALVVTFLLTRLVREVPSDGLVLSSELIEILAKSLLVTAAVLVPLTVAVGVWSTHRIVGPLHSFLRTDLTELASGGRPGPCRVRQEDELQDLCELLNRATEPLRAAPAPAPELRREAA